MRSCEFSIELQPEKLAFVEGKKKKRTRRKILGAGTSTTRLLVGFNTLSGTLRFISAKTAQPNE